METKFLQQKFAPGVSSMIFEILKKARTILVIAPIMLFSFDRAKAQNVAGFGYSLYTSEFMGSLTHGTVFNYFTVTYSGTWATQSRTTFAPVDVPSGLSNYVQPNTMLELGAWVTLNPVAPPFPTATYTFASALPATSVMFIQDVDALESFTIEFFDASGAVLNPGTIGTYNLSTPDRSTVAASATALTVTAINNINSAESLSNFVFTSGLVKEIRITQIASRDDLAASGTAEFYFAAPSTPTTDSESSLNNTAASNVTLDLLTGDLLGNGSQATPASVTVNFTAPAGGTVSGNTISVPGEGEWTYVPATGMITFDPETGMTGNPTPLNYTLTETATGLTSNSSSETVTYRYLPTPNPDVATTNIDTPVTIPVLVNDSFGPDGPSTSSITVTEQPTHGTATVLDNGTPSDPTDDQIIYTPNSGWFGTDVFTYQICDGAGGSGGGGGSSGGGCEGPECGGRIAATGDCATTTVTITIPNPAMPVDLISFNGKQIDNRIILTWKTANEVNFSHFEILKSTNDAKNFGSIGKEISSNQNAYNYADNEPNEGKNYYKLRMVDLDGTSKLSKIISVSFDKNAPFTSGRVQNVNIHGTSEINIYPNPASKVLLLKGVDFEAVKSVEIINTLGSIVQNTTSLSDSGIDIANLSSGTYIAKVTFTDGTVSTQKLIVNK